MITLKPLPREMINEFGGEFYDGGFWWNTTTETVLILSLKCWLNWGNIIR